MSEAAIALPHRAPYTVDDLFTLPDDGNRYEVFGGALHMSPAPAPLHQIVGDELRAILWSAVRPGGAFAITAVAVRVSDEDGPIPDVTVTTADVRRVSGALPIDSVHTVIEVVSPSSTLMDRAFKRELYLEAGIPCYWRVELKAFRRYTGRLPLIVVHVRDRDEWREVEAAAGTPTDLPIAVGRAEWISVTLDPAALVDL